MWTDTTRTQYALAPQTLPSDLTDAQGAVLEPFLPQPSHVGRPRKWPLRRSRNRPIAQDFEQTMASATVWLDIASIQLFARHIARA